MYSLYIEDNFGVTVYSSAMPANGTAYINNGNIAKYTVQGVNHLEMGALDTPLKNIIDEAIDKVLNMKKRSTVVISGEAVSMTGE